MTLFNYISTNIDRVKAEVKAGIIPCSMLSHWEIYSRFDLYKKMGHNTELAVFFVSEERKVKERWVYKIKAKMETEINESVNCKL
jgi:hypothetical protein